jgi:hypothetical protein
MPGKVTHFIFEHHGDAASRNVFATNQHGRKSADTNATSPSAAA